MIDRVLYFCVGPKVNNETQARNEMEGFLLGGFAWVFLRISADFFTAKAEKSEVSQTETYPQGKIKNLDKLLYSV